MSKPSQCAASTPEQLADNLERLALKTRVAAERDAARPVQTCAPDQARLEAEFHVADSQLLDAWEAHEAHPDTFEVPDAETIRSIDCDWQVLVDLDGKDRPRRVWTRVVFTREDRLFATLENDTDLEHFRIGDKISFCTRHMLRALRAQDLLAEFWFMQVSAGMATEATAAQKVQRHLAHYVNACWSVHPDPFCQNVESADHAVRTEVSVERVVRHFEEVHPKGLHKMGLSPEDFAICHLSSEAELYDSMLDDAMQVHFTDDMKQEHPLVLARKAYHMLLNITLQPRLFAAAFDR